MLSLIASATLVLSAQTSPAQALHQEVADALAKHKTIQGTIVVTRGSQTEKVRFKLMKPNFFVLEGEKESSWCDGEQNYTLMDGAATPHCNLASPDSIDAPFLRGLEGFTKNPNGKLKPKALTTAKCEGNDCRAITYEQPATESEAGSAPKMDVTVYIDAKKPQPVGWKAKGGQFEIRVSYKELVFDKELKKSDFRID